MKKHLFFAATAALVLASCSSDSVDFTQADVLQAQDDNSVQFDTYMGKTGTTRAEVDQTYSKGAIGNADNADQGITDLKKARFGVFAYQTTNTDYVPATPTALVPNFMYNQEVKFDDSPAAWVYSPVKYWPNGKDAANAAGAPSNTATSNNNDKLSFFAYAPYMAETSFTADYDGSSYPTDLSVASNAKKVASPINGIVAMTKNIFDKNVWVKYLMPNANQNEAVDLLWGTNGKAQYKETDNTPSTSTTIGTGYNVNLTKQTVGEKVKFLFKHALAKIGGNTETTTETYTEPASNTCGYMIKLDVDGNNGDNQTSFLGSTFTNTKTLVTVEKVEIKDGKSADDASWEITGVTTSNLANSGWFNIEQGKWENVEVATAGATYSITADKDNTDVTDATYSLNPNIKEGAVSVKPALIASDNWSTTSSDNAYTGGATGVTVAALPLFAKENVPGLMVIPGSGTPQTLYVRIKYHVRTLDANLKDKVTHVKQTITNSIDLSSLDPNKYYKIIMHLGLTSVKFEAVVADWQTANGGTFDENGHYNDGGTTPNETKVWLPSNVVALSHSVSGIAAGATSYTFDGSALGLGNFVSGTTEGFVTAANVNGSDSRNADLTITANTGDERSQTITLTYELGTVTLTITQLGV